MAKRRNSHTTTAQAFDAMSHRRDVIDWARSRIEARRLAGPYLPHDEPLTSETMQKPGELERVLNGIKQGFVQADQRHRTAIDHEVMRCVRIARFLNVNIRKSQHILEGKWLKHWLRHKKEKTEALRFVFIQTHANPKKASLYYRAMYKMFDEDVPVEDIPARVTAGGGYQALADAHVRFPRTKRDEIEGDDRKPRSSKLKMRDGKHDESDDERSRANDGEATSDSENEIEQAAREVTLVATFEENGETFLDLPLPCYANVLMHIVASPDGSRSVKIFSAEYVE